MKATPPTTGPAIHALLLEPLLLGGGIVVVGAGVRVVVKGVELGVAVELGSWLAGSVSRPF